MKGKNVFSFLYRTRVKVTKDETPILNFSLLFTIVAVVCAPWLAVIGLVVALALGYLLLLAGGEAYAAVGRMLVGILGAAFRGVGICVAAYFLLVRVRSRAGRVAIAAGLSLLAPGLFTAIGVAEQLFGIRKRFVIIKRKP